MFIVLIILCYFCDNPKEGTSVMLISRVGPQIDIIPAMLYIQFLSSHLKSHSVWVGATFEFTSRRGLDINNRQMQVDFSSGV